MAATAIGRTRVITITQQYEVIYEGHGMVSKSEAFTYVTIVEQNKNRLPKQVFKY